MGAYIITINEKSKKGKAMKSLLENAKELDLIELRELSGEEEDAQFVLTMDEAKKSRDVSRTEIMKVLNQ